MISQHGRVVKAIDLKSIGLCPREFESHSCRITIVLRYGHVRRSSIQSPQWVSLVWYIFLYFMRASWAHDPIIILCAQHNTPAFDSPSRRHLNAIMCGLSPGSILGARIYYIINNQRVNGLVAWFSLWVREVVGSIPTWPLNNLFCNVCMYACMRGAIAQLEERLAPGSKPGSSNFECAFLLD